MLGSVPLLPGLVPSAQEPEAQREGQVAKGRPFQLLGACLSLASPMESVLPFTVLKDSQYDLFSAEILASDLDRLRFKSQFGHLVVV